MFRVLKHTARRATIPPARPFHDERCVLMGCPSKTGKGSRGGLDMVKKLSSLFLTAAVLFAANGAHSQEALQNGGFENASGTSVGNNPMLPMAPWSIVAGDGNYSVLYADGASGSFPTAPSIDANGSAGHFLQLGAGANASNWVTGPEYAVQQFTVECDGTYRFGASFSGRGSATASSVAAGGTQIRTIAGSGVAGSPGKVVPQTGPPATRPWVVSEGITTLSASETYQFQLRPTKFAVADNAFVELIQCDVSEPDWVGNQMGMTFGLQTTATPAASSHVGCPGSDGFDCDPQNGDTPCSEELPMLCIRPYAVPTSAPSIVPITSPYHQWASEGSIDWLPPMSAPDTLSGANAACEAAFGSGSRVAEFHDGWGWHFWARGVPPTWVNLNTRFWTDIDDQPNGVCWDRNE